MSDYDEYEEIQRDQLAKSRYDNALLMHSNCSDPEHPGCVDCEEWEE